MTTERKRQVIGSMLAAVAVLFFAFTYWQSSHRYQPSPSSEPITDTRKQITDQSDAIYQSTVLVNSVHSENDYGSGYVIGENSVATNRHVADSFKNSPEDAMVRVGHKDANGNVTFTDFKIKQVKMPSDEALDIALLNLEPLEDGTKIFDLCKIAEFASPKEMQVGEKVTVVGYPGDKPYGTLWAGTGEVNEVMGSIFSFRVITAPGNSGSPLFNEEGKVVGMNNAGGDNSSFGFALSEEMIQFFKENME